MTTEPPVIMKKMNRRKCIKSSVIATGSLALSAFAVKKLLAKGFEAASQGQVTKAKEEISRKMTARQVLEEAVFIHRRKKLADENLIDFGSRSSYLECITTYAHGTAGHTAQQYWAMKQYDEVFGGDTSAERAKLLEGIMRLYRSGDGFFDCRYPDGRKFPAANLYDIGLVLTAIGDVLKPQQVKEMVAFVYEQLITPTWARCLSSTDFDALSGNRCDHQWAEDVYPKELGAAAKCYDELVQGNHWVICSGAHFMEMVLKIWFT